jgi:hypothetical protein
MVLESINVTEEKNASWELASVRYVCLSAVFTIRGFGEMGSGIRCVDAVCVITALGKIKDLD